MLYNEGMKKRKLDIDHLARLTNLSLTQKEKKSLQKQLEETVAYIKKLNRLKTENVAPVFQVTNNKDVFRPDKKRKGLTPKEALANASQKEGHYFVAPKIKWTEG